MLYFELLRDLKLVDEVPPWYSKIQPKSLYKSQDVQAFWDIPVFAEHNEVREDRVDARIDIHWEKIVGTIEMSCPWVENRGKKDEERDIPVFAEHNEVRENRFDGRGKQSTCARVIRSTNTM